MKTCPRCGGLGTVPDTDDPALGRPNDVVATARGLEISWPVCLCGHGLTWHDNDRLSCDFRYRQGEPSQCPSRCGRFREGQPPKRRGKATLPAGIGGSE